MSKKHAATSLIALGALGVVFGDIGTSTLYALQAIVRLGHIDIQPTYIYGIISLIIWAITLVVTVKYLGFITRANNHGEGGIMALVALTQHAKLGTHAKWLMVLLGILGMGLFYGDSIITPAISVLSAVEGVTTISPSISYAIVPVTVVILCGLFALQSRGTGTIGKVFGPIMLLWFLVSAVGGLAQIIQHPDVLVALLPTTALGFITAHPLVAFVSMGAVILAITGAEALYADMGHFGRKPIAIAWLACAFPALVLTYMGQGALIVAQPDAITSAYFLMFPDAIRIFVVALATVATLIASQAVIAGAFSLTAQAIQLGFAPRLTVRYTSSSIGQVYLPFINWLLCIAVVTLVIIFGSSANLAGAFGMAVSMALTIDTILFLIILRTVWQRSIIWVALAAICFLPVDLLFFGSSLTKLLHGGWLPISIAVLVFAFLSTWAKARGIIGRERQHIEGSLDSFIAALPSKKPIRLPGTAIYLGHHPGYTPLALHTAVDQLHELHERAVIVNVITAPVPHVSPEDRIVYDDLGSPDDGISHLTLQFGFKDVVHVPHALTDLQHISPEVDFEPTDVTYFISTSEPSLTRRHNLARWRKYLYRSMAANAADPTDYYHLPPERTLELRSFIDL
ncbi:potassium transporter Kup [Candidatus Mycosynbacter amalyticus]|uniref:Probable potassium transport system protein Kup n=1 Tax=Candidatus Mycosynbacter amalyticus TaxID=2665156 RepID=A0A857MSU9_9BACT|nr:KUP/HAK/KT family potassium transporter [Candidatus Mycosynbacter amalyticus]QHN42517.1 potassium transporter Kup [Candidatus Mycosynbacter amalyticus]